MIIKINNTDVTQYIDVQSISGEIVLSAQDTVTLSTIALTTPIYCPEGISMELLDGTTRIFKGRVRDYTITRVGKHYRQSITVQSYESICYYRTVAGGYVDKTSAYIVNDLITDNLLSEGITAGTISTGITIAKMDNKAISIGDMLDDLALANGFKWWIDQDLVLHFKDKYTFQSITAPTNSNIDQVRRSLAYYANKVFMLYTDEYGYEQSTFMQNSAEITRMSGLDGSGVYGTVIRSSLVDNLTEADQAVLVELTKRSLRNEEIYMTSYQDVLTIGDYFTITDTGLSLSGQYYVDTVSFQGVGSVLKYTYILKPYDDMVDKDLWLKKWAKLISKDSSKNEKTKEKKTYTQSTEPTGAKEGDLWIKNDSYAMHDTLVVSTNTTLVPSGADLTLVTATSLITITLFTAVGNEGVQRIIKNQWTSSSNIAVDTYGAETIDGSLAVTLAPAQSLRVVSNGSVWEVV